MPYPFINDQLIGGLLTGARTRLKNVRVRYLPMRLGVGGRLRLSINE